MTASSRIADLLAVILRDSPAEVAFERACLACVEALPVSCAAISVMTGTAAWSTLCASDAMAVRMEDLQFTLGTGPCREAYRVGGPILVADLTDPDSGAAWPMFAGQTVEAGVRAAFAFPLQLGAIRPGVLGLYRDLPGALPQGAVSGALLAADMLCLALLSRLDGEDTCSGQARAGMWADHAVLGRAEVHQATGMVMSQLGMRADEAMIRLRGLAFTRGLLLAEVAAEVLAGRIRLEQD
jgi:hypothetical protein